MTPDATDLDTPKPRRKFFSLRSLIVMLIMGYVVYELTALPGLAALMMCLKFGWDDFLTARWLWKTDPDRGRGRACYWLYLSAGLWKIATMALVMTFLVAILFAIQHPPARPGQPAPPPLPRDQSPEHLVVGAMLTMLVGFTLCSLTTFRAIWHGVRYKVRFWLNPGVHTAREQQVWPPVYGVRNRAVLVLFTGIILGYLVGVPILLAIILAAIDQFLVKVPPSANLIVFVVMVLVVLPLTVLVMKDWLVNRLNARHPSECWGTEPLPALVTNPMTMKAHPDEHWMNERPENRV